MSREKNISVGIGEPLVLPNGQTIKNRIVKAAMTEGLADPAGRPSSELFSLYRRWSRGGSGLLVTGNVIVDRGHLERAGNVRIAETPDHLMRQRLHEWVKAGRSGGSALWAQLSHAGRQTPIKINPSPRAASAVAMELGRGKMFGLPKEMRPEEIDELVEQFARAAVTCQEAGFDGVQIHAAHGYLLSGFLSPLTNKRSDQWGGSLENRARLLLQIIRAIRAAVGPAFGVGVKLNSADFQRGGFDIEDSVRVAQWLDAESMDMLEISGGNYEAPRMVGMDDGVGAARSTIAREAYFLSFAPRIKAALNHAPLMVTGGFRTAAAMDASLIEESVDLIGVARPLCGDPDGPQKLIDGTMDRLPAYEDMLRLGPGVLGPRSRFYIMKALNIGGAQAWYSEQMDRMGAGLEPTPPRGLLRAMRSQAARSARTQAVFEDWRAQSVRAPDDRPRPDAADVETNP